MKEFITFVQELFPSINPYTAEQAMKSLHQLIKGKEKLEIFTNYSFDYLVQGDIVSELPFIYVDEDGQDRELNKKGILLSNTCDSEREKFLLFAPVFHINTYLEEGLSEANIRNNKYTKLLYLPSLIFQDHVVDLNIINSFPRLLIEKLIDKKQLTKIKTFNLFGYYLLLAKLTVHLMRPEDTDVNQSRESLGA
ncbi:hypothetical protein [Heyndrickxia acidicola]|uniref:Uncharacterized protein n=1 Tax=Heyndrickxia acidicola TaxID=209389 RepID=A0ABU6MD26_9BACI|nr:hypothetical protein [Heyndrickxia acidicola]MED1202572.1 hypothetical protein [Heyndrickxia acidicola]